MGGHDRDMFIQVTSGQYAGLPLVDASLGGCIMTCSQFERCAGRELSKKWKESIHVVGEGEGSRATLLAWLKRRAEQDFGAGVVGKKVWVCWCADAEYYQGTVMSYNREGGKHTVQYSSRLTEELHLPVELISFDADKPMMPSQQGPAASAPAALHEMTAATTLGVTPIHLHRDPVAATVIPGLGGTTGGTVSEVQLGVGVGVTTTPTLWHQGSGISVTSSYAEELRGNAALTALATGVRKGLRAGQRRSRALVRVAEDAGVVGDMPPPKRALSAPAAVLLAEAAAVAAAMEENPNAYAPGGSIGATGLGVSPCTTCAGGSAGPAFKVTGGTVSPITPGRPLSQHPQQSALGTLHAALNASLPVTSLVMPLPPPPPGAGTNSPEALTAAVGWMHDVALSLDNELDGAEHAMHVITPRAAPSFSAEGPAAAGGAASGPSPTPGPFFVTNVSISGRFQALLGLLRGTPACLEGIYEGMVRRFEFFAGSQPLQRRKMAEFLMATVVEASAPRDLFKSSPTPARSTSPSLPNSQSQDRIKGPDDGAMTAPMTTAGAAEHGDGSTHTALPHHAVQAPTLSPMKF